MYIAPVNVFLSFQSSDVVIFLELSKIVNKRSKKSYTMKNHFAPNRRKIVIKRRKRSKNELIKECLNRPCSVFLTTITPTCLQQTTQTQQNLKLWKKHFRPFLANVKIKKLDWQQEALKECLSLCSVELDEIRYAGKQVHLTLHHLI